MHLVQQRRGIDTLASSFSEGREMANLWSPSDHGRMVRSQWHWDFLFRALWVLGSSPDQRGKERGGTHESFSFHEWLSCAGK